LERAFKLKKPERNIAILGGWISVLAIASGTDGSINLSEVLPEGGAEAGAKIDQGIQKVDDAQEQVDAWWATEANQDSPVDRAKYETANAALGRAGEILYAADAAVILLQHLQFNTPWTRPLKMHGTLLWVHNFR
jgi:hypothetical protein